MNAPSTTLYKVLLLHFKIMHSKSVSLDDVHKRLVVALSVSPNETCEGLTLYAKSVYSRLRMYPAKILVEAIKRVLGEREYLIKSF